MKLKKIKRAGILAGLLGSIALLAGCSRSTINYQIAESIGTLGKYENNEPVETPQMKVEREQKESEDAKAQALQEKLDQAEQLAGGYWYEEALGILEGISGEEAEDERVVAAIADCQEGQKNMTVFEGDIPHLCFPGLIEDTMRAFDGDEMSYTYSGAMVTTSEFKKILESLYEDGYILIDIHQIAGLETDSGRAVTTMETKELRLPKGKKPLILSQDNLNYGGIKNGDGIATKLTLDEEGKVKAPYTDEEGHDLAGDYDFVPILDAFVEEHPDFSFKGAKGIVSVSGSNGVFGYPVADTAIADYEENRTTVKTIADTMKENGWSIACAGYSHSKMDAASMSLETFQEEIDSWMEEISPLVGKADIMFMPYGAFPEEPSDQLEYLLDEGLVYLCSLWGNQDYREVRDGYLYQTRRFVDGYTLLNAPDYFTGFFNVAGILDENR